VYRRVPIETSVEGGMELVWLRHLTRFIDKMLNVIRVLAVDTGQRKLGESSQLRID
jgi:hypothetical protein